MEHSAVHGPEMELPYHDRLVNSLRKCKSLQIRPIDVITENIAIFRRDPEHFAVGAGETAAEIKHIRSYRLELSSDHTEIRLDELRIEGLQVSIRPCRNLLPVRQEPVP